MILQGVFASDSINLNGTRLSAGALISALQGNFEIGTPLLVGHDFLRTIGWNRPIAVHIEPGLARLYGISEIVETLEQSEKLLQSLNALQEKLAEKHKLEIEVLNNLLATFLLGKEKISCKECIAFVESDLAVRFFPDIFSLRDDDGLIPLNRLTPIGYGAFQIDNFVIFANSFFRRSFSRLNDLNKPFLEQIQNLSKEGNTIKIALDPDMVGLASTYRENFEYEYWWGPKFDNNLASIPPGVTIHEASEYEKLIHGISSTQFRWQSRSGEHIFQLEELKNIPTITESSTQIGCRYGHSIIKETTCEIIHFDGAVRFYSKDEMLKRLNVKNVIAGQCKYVKLWRIDGLISLPIWKTVISDYFRDNHLVGEYFGAPKEKINELYVDMNKNTEGNSLLEEYVPYSMSQGMGIRIALSYHPFVGDDSIERRVVSFDTLSFDDENIPIIESETIELRKALERTNTSLFVPEDIRFVNYKDFYVNLPLILHNETTLPESLYKTLDSIRMLVSGWSKKGQNKVASYSVGFPVNGKELRISVLGHVSDLNEWLSNSLSDPPTSEEEIDEWTEKVSKFIENRFPKTYDKPPLFKTLMTSGILLIKRKLMEGTDYRLLYSKQHHALEYELKISEGEKELAEALKTGEISPAIGFVILESICSKCGGSYLYCNCSKLLDEGVVQKISKMQNVFLFWTDRPV